MKRIFFSILIIGFVVSCSQETEPEVRQSLENTSEEKIAESALMTNTLQLFTEPDWRVGVSVRNSFSSEPRPGFSEFFAQDMQRFYHNDSEKVHWKVHHNWIRGELSKMMGKNDEFTEEEKKYSTDIQSVVLGFINLELLDATGEEHEVAKVLSEYYFPILMKHKAVDLSIMADALLLTKPYISSQEYNTFRSFILEQGEANMQYVKENWEESRDGYEASEGTEKVGYLYHGRKMEQMGLERKYVRDLLDADVAY